MSRRNLGENGKESILIICVKQVSMVVKMWRVKFVPTSQGRNKPKRVHGVVSKMDLFCRDAECSSWQETASALQCHFELVERSEMSEKVLHRANPRSAQFAFSLSAIVHPNESKLSEELTEQGLSMQMWKHPSRFVANGIVKCATQWEIEPMTTLLGKLFGVENIDFVQYGFDEEKWRGDDCN